MSEGGQWFESDPLWFKRAVFYEVHLRGFFDGNDDGSGDLRGLTDKLDYLQWLGVDCIWLLPMYPSPLRDDGYDIADFYDVHPDYGTRRRLPDARRRGAPARHPRDRRPRRQPHLRPTTRGSRRRARAGSRRSATATSGRDTDDRYQDARIIFVDTEVSNWTWDPIAGAVLLASLLLAPARPELRQPRGAGRDARRRCASGSTSGIDGFRLDAVPYLFEREGTNCENLPETHAYLKRLRAEIDAGYPDRVLLAEANQWPRRRRRRTSATATSATWPSTSR